MSPVGIHMEEELESQPTTWATAIQLTEQRALLPADGQRVAVIGCGTSWFIAQAYAALREDAGAGVTDAYTPTEFRDDRVYDSFVLISRSGTTTEIAEFLKNKVGDTRSVAIVGIADSPVAKLASDFVDLGFADEKSVVQTRFATTCLMFLRSSLEVEAQLTKAIEDARQALSEKPATELVDAEQYTFLGQRWVLGLATEAALKMRESAQAWTESYSSMEYRHGPIAIAAPGRVVWSMSTPPEGLADQVAATGATFVHHEEDPMAALVRLHRVALDTARARGLDPDSPRNLTRSVVLGR